MTDGYASISRYPHCHFGSAVVFFPERLLPEWNKLDFLSSERRKKGTANGNFTKK
jgi:hypothetical protein